MGTQTSCTFHRRDDENGRDDEMDVLGLVRYSMQRISILTDSRALGYVEFRGCGARMAFHTSKCVDAEIPSPKSPSVGKYRQGEKWVQDVKWCLGSTSIS